MERLRIRLFLPLLFFSALWLNQAFSPGWTNAADEEIQSEEYSWDFGKAKEGLVLEHDFIISNRTEKPIRIKDVMTSCSCTVSKIAKKELAPGEDTLLKVRFKTEGYKGKVHQYVYVNVETSVPEGKTDKQAAGQTDDSIMRFTITAEVLK